MVTEPGLTGMSPSINRNRLPGLPDQSTSLLPNHTQFTPVSLYDGFNYNLSSSDHCNTVVAAPSEFIREIVEVEEEDPADDFDFSDAVLGYISQMLNEEDMDDKVCMLQESLDLEAAERSLYEAIGKKYPPSPERNLVVASFAERNGENLDRVVPGNYTGGDCIGFGNGGIKPLSGGGFTLDFRNPQSRCSSVLSVPQSNGFGMDQSSKKSLYADSSGESHQSVWLFRDGIEEANRLLPEQNELIVNFREESCMSRGRKNSSRDEICVEEEERSSKLPAVFGEDILRSDVVDKILVHVPGEESMKEFDALREVLKKGVEKKKASVAQGGKRRARGRGRGRGGGRGGGGQNGKKEVVDLRSLLIHCAQAVAADDRRCAGQLLKQIRQHSTPFGDGNQRLAHCFANGLEARLAGTGSQIYKGIVSKPRSAAAVLKAHQLFLACCPFRKLSYFIT
ncbi:PREDICTED: scarecrow-like protein 9, partial [Camelina sativa]|uniref:Scarecrow-like protein 9 n=1 Tax=Camelina sativa TaxID=90675 RepID=A0ABM0ZB06_CAMSA